MIFQNAKTPFQAKKTRSSKSQNIDIFFKGVDPWFWSKNSHFFNLFFYAIQTRKIFFMISQNEKTSFQALKTRSSKSRKIDIFQNGLTHGFGPKKAIFPTFFFYVIQTRKIDSMIFQNAKTLYQAKKTRSSKSRNIDIFFKGVNPWFWSKNGHFSNFVCLRNIHQENVFYNIRERKNAFPGQKNKKVKKSKN